MKKTLLFAAALLAASPLFAQEAMEDITPSGYDFANMPVGLINIPVGYNEANPKAPYDPIIDQYYDNGLFIVVGGQMVSGTNYIDRLRPGVSVVDLGGEVGRVFCCSGYQSTVNDVYKDTYNVELNIPQCTDALNWFNFSWFTDKDNTPTDGSKENPNIRCRIVMHAHSNAIGEADNIINKVYMMTKQGNVISTTTNNNDEFNAERSSVSSAEFALYDNDGEPVTDDDENYVYDPTRWLVYEFDFYCPGKDLDGNFAHPVRLKMEMNNGNLNHSTLFIKELKFFKLNNANTDPIVLTRKHSYITLVPGSGSAISQLSGNRGDMKVYNMAGQYVGRTIDGLSSGVYVSKQNGKVEKVLVK